ncbi:cold-shock protein [Bradyrhizobium sp. 49]|nr:cold-shock protein [Bradyrhizobium sp. 84]MCK1376047.1 cold-shock protein [Bradyrhizobium sp. 49]
MVQRGQEMRLHQPEVAGAGVFVHISAVEKAGYTNLAEGVGVSYELMAGRSGKTSAEICASADRVALRNLPNFGVSELGCGLREKHRLSKSPGLRPFPVRRTISGAHRSAVRGAYRDRILKQTLQ